MSKLSVSVIVPCYNCERTISQTLSSLFNQTLSSKEIICIDDGSTDNTSKEIQGFNKVKYFKQKNSGPAKARNAGARKAKGDIIVFTDSDCVLDKKWLEEMVKPFKDENVGGVQGAYKSKQKEWIARFGQIEIEHRYERMKKSKAIDWIGSYSGAFKRKEFLKLGGYDESFPMASGEDPEFSFRLAESGKKLVFNPKAIVFHKHPAKLSKYLKIKYFRAFFRPKMYSKHKGKAINDSYTPQSLKFQILLSWITIFALIGLATRLLGSDGILFGFSIFFFLVFSANFIWFAWKKDKTVGIISPLILFLRSIVFGVGLIHGILRGLK